MKLKNKEFKYAIPSTFTLCAMFSAFFSILESASSSYILACYGILLAMFFDGLDGRSARFTNTCSAFGASFDSITDMLAYGVAPSIMLYSWSLFHFQKIGCFISFVFCACAALRLARFNVMITVTDNKYFYGLSSTLAGGVLATFVLACEQYGLYNNVIIILSAFLTLFIAILMISNIKFYSFKEIHGSPKLVALVILILIIVISSLTYKFKGIIVFAIIIGYILINLLLQKKFNSSITTNDN